MRSERARPWRPKPSQAVLDMLAAVTSTTMYVMQQCGPTSFIVKEDTDVKQHHVTVGSVQQCTCHRRAQAPAELCVHILFVMVKVLKVQPENPLVWQLSLVDRELDEILRNRNSAASSSSGNSRRIHRRNKSDGVSRKVLEPDDICPICYDDIHRADLAQLTWCQQGCGQNIHGKCMKVWMKHNSKTQSKELRCPMCRCEWGAFTWRPPPKRRKGQFHSSGLHVGSKCHSCSIEPICGWRYECTSCWKLDVCSSCFKKGAHPEHDFVCFEHVGAKGIPASRNLFEVTCCQLRSPRKQVASSCVLSSALARQHTCKIAPPAAAIGALCIGAQPTSNEVKPAAARLRTGRSTVAGAGPQSLPRLQHQNTLASAAHASAQAGTCGDLTLFGVRGGMSQPDPAGLHTQPQGTQGKKSWGRFNAAKRLAALRRSDFVPESDRQ